ncbi:MAG TPA: SH3 domain-containing protein [Anaerolineales bacterium]|nr:SH3 domain-containing protein [Anaerolineales bacterium]
MRKIIGPDVSFYQDDPNTPKGIDFVRMRQVADFVIIRAGQNLWEDRDFKVNWRRAKEAGLPRGSYWFYDSRADPKQQAELWVSLLDGDFGELPLFLDLEEAYGGDFRGWTYWRQCLERLKELVGSKEIGIYTAYFYWVNNAPSQPTELEYFHRYPLWIANYGVSQPLVPKPWNSDEWLFWQFTAMGDGLAYGVESSEIDLNYFNGDAEAFARRFNVPVPDDRPPPDPTGKKYVVNAGALYVREGPGTNFKPIGYLQRNDIVEAFAASADGKWLQVRRERDGLMGWCSITYLVRLEAPPPPPPPPPDDGTGGARYRVTAGTLYVREGPGTTFKAVGLFYRDDIVEELESGTSGEWKRVRRITDQLTGWCRANYLLRLTTPPPPPDEPPSENKYKVTAARLHVREGPGTNFRSLGYIQQNEIVEALETNADRTWIRIRRSDGLIGWASARYLTPFTPPPDDQPGTKYRITASRLNVREGPATTYKSLGYVSQNEVVEALSTNADNTWRQIRRSDGLIGWASARYMTPVENQ